MVYDKERLAVVEALNNWQYTLEDVYLPCVVQTDYKAFSYYLSSRVYFLSKVVDVGPI